MIFGDINSFAIELEPGKPDPRIGYFLLWANDVHIGKREETFIKPNLIALSRVVDISDQLPLNIEKKTPEKILKKILDSENLYTKTLVGFGESFDRFLLRIFLFQKSVFIVWCEVESELKYAQIVKVEINLYLKILTESRQYFESFGL
jgi:hypothetical protein